MTIFSSPTRPPSDLGITSRDLDMLAMAARGMSNKEIAERHKTTAQVVKNRWQMITAVLRAENRTEAVAMAIESGWVSRKVGVMQGVSEARL